MEDKDVTVIINNDDNTLDTKVPYVIFVYLNEDKMTARSQSIATLLLSAYVSNVVIVSDHGLISQSTANLLEIKYCREYKIVRLYFGSKEFFVKEIARPANSWFGFNPRQKSSLAKRRPYDIVEDAKSVPHALKDYLSLSAELEEKSFDYDISEILIWRDGQGVQISFDQMMSVWLTLNGYAEYKNILPTFVYSLEQFGTQLNCGFTRNDHILANMPRDCECNSTNIERFCTSLLKYNRFKHNILIEALANVFYRDIGIRIDALNFVIEFNYESARKLRLMMIRWGASSGNRNYDTEFALKYNHCFFAFVSMFKLSSKRVIPLGDDMVLPSYGARFRTAKDWMTEFMNRDQ